jgi:proteic killer suppression protein
MIQTTLEVAAELEELRFLPGNLWKSSEATEQPVFRSHQPAWRICFVWTDGGPENVEIVDYH